MTTKNTSENNVGLKLFISHAPHAWKGISVSRIMWLVMASLALPTLMGIYLFGYYALGVILVCMVFAVGTEWACKKLRKKPFVMDGSAALTGLLLALILPPTMPLWQAAVGSIFAIAIGKEVFGGLGFNIFNPALAGRAFLSVCFAGRMTTWALPMGFKFDAVTGATPLNESFVMPAAKASLHWDLFIGNVGGSIGETSLLLCLIGGIFLLVTKIIKWHIPVAFMGSVAVFALIFGEDIGFHLLAGGVVFGAFFMATDYATSPLTVKGRLIFGVGCGLITMLIRQFGGMPEGVCFSILIMNSLVPLIDRYIQPKPFGFRKDLQKA